MKQFLAVATAIFCTFLSLSARADEMPPLKPLDQLLNAEELDYAQTAYHSEFHRVFAKHCDRKFGPEKCVALKNQELSRSPWYANLRANARVGSPDPQGRQVLGFSGPITREVYLDPNDRNYEIRKYCRGALSIIVENELPTEVVPHVYCDLNRISLKKPEPVTQEEQPSARDYPKRSKF